MQNSVLDPSFVPADTYGSFLIYQHIAIQFDQQHMLKMLSSSSVCFWSKSGVYMYVDVCLGFQFYCIDELVHFEANTILVLLL